MVPLRNRSRYLNRTSIINRQQMRSLPLPILVCLLGTLFAEAHTEVPRQDLVGCCAHAAAGCSAAASPLQAHPPIGSAGPSNVLASLRGGGSEVFDPYHQHYQQQQADDAGAPRRIQVSDVVLALRWTAEMNRQLESGASATAVGSWLSVPPRTLDLIRGGGGGGGAVRSYAGSPAVATQQGSGALYRIPSPQSLAATNSRGGSNQAAATAVAGMSPPRLTIFHTAHPRVSANKHLSGVSRWGPDLALYVEHLLVNVLQVPNMDDDEDDAAVSTVLTMALLYVDRAASVETPRSNGYLPTPYLTPRTTHRLLLASLLLAAQATAASANGGRGVDVAALYARASDALGVSAEHVHEMVAWMKGALGDPGWFVAPDQLLEFKQLWAMNFGDLRRPQRSQELHEAPSTSARDAPRETIRTAPAAQTGTVEQTVRVSTYADGAVPPQHEHRVYAQAVHPTY
jgi:hypothetical protein